jgi:hypothetical protein
VRARSDRIINNTNLFEVAFSLYHFKRGRVARLAHATAVVVRLPRFDATSRQAIPQKEMQLVGTSPAESQLVGKWNPIFSLQQEFYSSFHPREAKAKQASRPEYESRDQPLPLNGSHALESLAVVGTKGRIGVPWRFARG